MRALINLLFFPGGLFLIVLALAYEYADRKAIGAQMADIPPLLAGIDPCFSCNDRTVVIRRPRRDPEVVAWDALRRSANSAWRR